MTAPTETVELPTVEGLMNLVRSYANRFYSVGHRFSMPADWERLDRDWDSIRDYAERLSRSPVVGAVGGEPQPCKRCDGAGQLRRVGSTPMGRPIMEVDNCPVCNGSGASPTAAGPMTARMLTDKETMDAYCVPWPEGSPFPKWMARMDAVIRKFCEVNGIGVSPTGSPEGEVSNE